MSNSRTFVLGARHASPHRAHSERGLDDVLRLIYLRQAWNDDLILICRDLRPHRLSMEEVRRKILKLLGETCQAHYRAIARAEAKITKAHREMVRFLAASRKWMAKGHKIPRIDENPSKLELALEVYQKYQQVSKANQKAIIVWENLKKLGRFEQYIAANGVIHLSEMELNNRALKMLAPHSDWKGIENFRDAIAQLNKNSQSQPLTEMLNVFLWRPESSDADGAAPMQIPTLSHLKGELHKECEHKQNVTHNPRKKVLIDNIMKNYEKLVISSGCKEESLIDECLNHKNIEHTRNFIMDTFALFGKLTQIEQKETEDESRPAPEPKKKKNKKKKNKKNKGKKKQQNQQNSVEAPCRLDPAPEQLGPTEEEQELGPAEEEQDLGPAEEEQDLGPAEEEQSSFQEDAASAPYLETVNMLKGMIIDDRARTRCATRIDSVDWWKGRASKF